MEKIKRTKVYVRFSKVDLWMVRKMTSIFVSFLLMSFITATTSTTTSPTVYFHIAIFIISNTIMATAIYIFIGLSLYLLPLQPTVLPLLLLHLHHYHQSNYYHHYHFLFLHQYHYHLFKSSRPELFCKKGLLKNFAKFQERICARVCFLIKLQAWDLQLY